MLLAPTSQNMGGILLRFEGIGKIRTTTESDSQSMEGPMISKRQPHLFRAAITNARHPRFDNYRSLGTQHHCSSLARNSSIQQRGVSAYPTSPLMNKASLMVRFFGSNSSLHAFNIGDCCWVTFPVKNDGGWLSVWSLRRSENVPYIYPTDGGRNQPATDVLGSSCLVCHAVGHGRLVRVLKSSSVLLISKDFDGHAEGRSDILWRRKVTGFI